MLNKNTQAYFAEFIGTLLLVFAGCGAIVIDQYTAGAVGHSGIALTFGLVVMSLIYALGDVSGAHFNPAVTLGFTVANKFDKSKIFPYISAQIIGALIACILLRFLFPSDELLGTTLPKIDIMRVFVIEIILTYILMLVIIKVATGTKEAQIMSGVAIGGVVWFEAQFAGPITGASMNPARSIAPAIVSGNLEHLWLYIIAPIIGALLATKSYLILKAE